MIMDYYKGYVYTRDPINGDNVLCGKLIDGYENDNLNNNFFDDDFEILFKSKMPDIYDRFYDMCKKIERHFKEIQYIEFEILNDQIYILSCEYGKRTAQSAFKIACDLADKNKKEEPAPLEFVLRNFRPKEESFKFNYDKRAVSTFIPQNQGNFKPHNYKKVWKKTKTYKKS